MSRGYPSKRRRSSPLSAFALLVFGLLAFAAATLTPVQRMLSSPVDTMSTGAPVLTGPVVVTSGGLLLISFVSIVLGLVLLTLRA